MESNFKFPSPEERDDDQFIKDKYEDIEDDGVVDMGLVVALRKYLKELDYESDALNFKRADIREQMFSLFNDVELVRVFNKSSEFDWQKKPNYYDAILRELINRNLIN